MSEPFASIVKKSVSSITGSARQLYDQSRVSVLITRIELTYERTCRLVFRYAQSGQ